MFNISGPVNTGEASALMLALYARALPALRTELSFVLDTKYLVGWLFLVYFFVDFCLTAL